MPFLNPFIFKRKKSTRKIVCMFACIFPYISMCDIVIAFLCTLPPNICFPPFLYTFLLAKCHHNIQRNANFKGELCFNLRIGTWSVNWMCLYPNANWINFSLVPTVPSRTVKLSNNIIRLIQRIPKRKEPKLLLQSCKLVASKGNKRSDAKEVYKEKINLNFFIHIAEFGFP